MVCGLLGETLKHSYSPQIHKCFGDYHYNLFEIKHAELATFLREGNFTGLNVTMPYKKAVIPYCNELSSRAKEIGAVNTIIKLSNGDLIGHNSDYYGFETLLIKSGLRVQNKKVLVLGSGGASATVTAVLRAHFAIPVVISRAGENNYQNLHLHKDAAIIINTTPVGMYPDTGMSPIDLELFPKLEGVLDLIYNPGRTKLLMEAEKRNLIAMNGLWMLVAQAKESAEWFLSHSLSNDLLESTYTALCHAMSNIILIGMPGCGKSTIGYHLANLLGRRFYDSDLLIEEKIGMTPADIIMRFGEDHFREIEWSVLQELGKESGLVIATGGGCVTLEKNYECLHQNGVIIWLQRDLSQLSTEGRPISQSTSLQHMYEARCALYDKFSDRTVLNDASPERVAVMIAQLEDGI